tara:strand:+ start:1685 stop:2605 length:921 start_codon:yes stop_codon:yes gene_type:complete
MSKITISVPSSVANVSCGFDVLGFCLEKPCDEMTVEIKKAKDVEIRIINEKSIPSNSKYNVCGPVAFAMIQKLNLKHGFRITIIKNIKPGSGIGSSAASAAGTAFAINCLTGNKFSKLELVKFAMLGEEIASGVKHADNLSPVIFGGFTLVRSLKPLDVITLPSLKELYVIITHPLIELKTKDARVMIEKKIDLDKATKQWGNLGGFVAALFKKDYELLSKTIEDVIVEPQRMKVIPNFKEIVTAASKYALGSGISGAGPSIFSICKGRKKSELVLDIIKEITVRKNMQYNLILSKINTAGIKIIN